MDCGNNCFIFFADQRLNLLKLQNYLCEISCVSFNITVVFIPNSSETFFNAHHNSLLFLCYQLKNFFINFSAYLMIWSDGFLKWNNKWIEFNQVTSSENNWWFFRLNWFKTLNFLNQTDVFWVEIDCNFILILFDKFE